VSRVHSRVSHWRNTPKNVASRFTVESVPLQRPQSLMMLLVRSSAPMHLAVLRPYPLLVTGESLWLVPSPLFTVHGFRAALRLSLPSLTLVQAPTNKTWTKLEGTCPPKPHSIYLCSKLVPSSVSPLKQLQCRNSRLTYFCLFSLWEKESTHSASFRAWMLFSAYADLYLSVFCATFGPILSQINITLRQSHTISLPSTHNGAETSTYFR
jgi:hypothetical protein